MNSIVQVKGGAEPLNSITPPDRALGVSWMFWNLLSGEGEHQAHTHSHAQSKLLSPIS